MILLVLGLIFFSYGLISFLSSSAAEEEVEFSQIPSEKPVVKKLVVDVQGAVVNPGVYQLESDSRIHDALIKAGGLSEDADREWVSKHLNLAAKVPDGVKVYVPKAGETTDLKNVHAVGQAGFTVGSGSVDTSGLININTATSQQLESLPGVGKVTAQKIIDARPYNALEDLLNNKVVGKAVFEKIKEKITL